MEFELTANEEETLLTLARKTLDDWIRSGKKPPLPEAAGNLSHVTGAFVTLTKNEELRGCIGNMTGQAPLPETIQKMAIAASTQDPRFPKVRVAELSEIKIEISVLSPMRRIKSADEIEVGKHGILLGKGWDQGVLLPQVAVEWNWNREEFLEQTCSKAGLPRNAWKDPETIIEIFSAIIFGEK